MISGRFDGSVPLHTMHISAVLEWGGQVSLIVSFILEPVLLPGFCAIMWRCFGFSILWFGGSSGAVACRVAKSGGPGFLLLQLELGDMKRQTDRHPPPASSLMHSAESPSILLWFALHLPPICDPSGVEVLTTNPPPPYPGLIFADAGGLPFSQNFFPPKRGTGHEKWLPPLLRHPNCCWGRGHLLWHPFPHRGGKTGHVLSTGNIIGIKPH